MFRKSRGNIIIARVMIAISCFFVFVFAALEICTCLFECLKIADAYDIARFEKLAFFFLSVTRKWTGYTKLLTQLGLCMGICLVDSFKMIFRRYAQQIHAAW